MQKLYEITYIDYAVQNDKKLVVESTPIKKGKKFVWAESRKHAEDKIRAFSSSNVMIVGSAPGHLRRVK